MKEVNSVKVIMGLGELTNLRKLQIGVNGWEKPERDAFASSLGKLRNLKCLKFTSGYTMKITSWPHYPILFRISRNLSAPLDGYSVEFPYGWVV